MDTAPSEAPGAAMASGRAGTAAVRPAPGTPGDLGAAQTWRAVAEAAAGGRQVDYRLELFQGLATEGSVG
jgi:hypothetical protein